MKRETYCVLHRLALIDADSLRRGLFRARTETDLFRIAYPDKRNRDRCRIACVECCLPCGKFTSKMYLQI